MRRRRRVFAILGVLALAVPSWAASAAPGVTPESLRRSIRDFVRARAPVPPDDVRIPRLDDFRIPERARGPVEVRLSANPRDAFEGHTPVTVTLLSGGEELKRGVVTVQVQRGRTVLVANRALPPRTVVRDADIRRARLPERRVPRGAIFDPARIVGRETVRSIAAGTPWREGLIRERPAVSKGQLVRMRIRRGALRIEAVGRAREDGAPGDRVRVINARTRREVIGTVGADGVLHVAF